MSSVGSLIVGALMCSEFMSGVASVGTGALMRGEVLNRSGRLADM